MKKRLVLCLDGTWNTLDARYPTNVVKLAEIVAVSGENVPQIVYYDEGVGTNQSLSGKTEAILGGAFGLGLEKNVEQAYRFLVFNYEPGDAIQIFGFSRGAFTARTLAGLIRNCGILDRSEARRVSEAMTLYRDRSEDAHPDEPKACEFRRRYSRRVTTSEREREWRSANDPDFDAETVLPLRIEFLGVWDTVGALGVPAHFSLLSDLFNKRHRFHDAKLSGMVASARHAQALDERRNVFAPSGWDVEKLEILAAQAEAEGRAGAYLQQWFPGDHGSVGGGGDITDLSDGAFLWMAEGAQQAGLAIRPGALEAFVSNPLGPLQNVTKTGFSPLNSLTSKKDRDGPRFADQVSDTATQRWREDAGYRPGSLGKVAGQLG